VEEKAQLIGFMVRSTEPGKAVIVAIKGRARRWSQSRDVCRTGLAGGDHTVLMQTLDIVTHRFIWSQPFPALP
jgi:hypothetical protein